MKEIKAVVGTNAWGSKVYGKLLRGSCVDETVINTAVKRAMELGLYVFDTAQDYDTDMSKEMVALSKQNILEQVGQSMMAQANQSNQGVLSLLQ